MKIRSITFFFHPNNQKEFLPDLAKKAQQLKSAFSQNNIEVQTIRLATTPYATWLPEEQSEKIKHIKSLEAKASGLGFEYLSIGPADIADQNCAEEIPAILAVTQNVFMTGMIADQQNGVSLPAVRRAAEIIYKAKSITPDGFTNLRYAALANVPPEIPFFPSAYHQGASPAFAIAVECADEAVLAFGQAQSLHEARANLLTRLQSAADKMQNIINQLANALDIPFMGFDFSLAPFPEDSCSLGKALETLGIARIGESGSLAAAAFIADTLDQGTWLRSGFNGLMMPVLEDSILAKRSIEQTLTLKDLLLYSAVCGIGLDTVPLPGDCSQETIYAILLDVAALAIRLNKPLTARLMPVPGLKAGDKTDFDFEYFENGAALATSAHPLSGLLTGNEQIQLKPRQAYKKNWHTKSR
ncbi:MAG: DUF711 family protein [Anaerolineaceae bacterium]|nr:DUF711 family protein [Anaerolineaceae bacterium]